MIVGSLQRHLSQRRGEGLWPPARVGGRSAAGAGKRGTGLVGVVGVEPPGHGFRRNLERLSPGRPLQGFEVDIRQPAFADQVFHLGGDFGREPGLKRFFLTALACLASSISVSHSRELTSIRVLTSWRNR